MGKWVAVQVVGMVVLAVGAQGAIRVLLDHSDRGLVSWAGGFGAALVGDLVLVVVGGALAWWGDAKRRTAA